MIRALWIPISHRPEMKEFLLSPNRQRPDPERVCLIPDLGYAVMIAEDVNDTWRIYRRYIRPLPGTLVDLRVNKLATALVRTVNPDASPVHEPALVTGIQSNGGDTDAPDTLIEQAASLWMQRTHAPVAQR